MLRVICSSIRQALARGTGKEGHVSAFLEKQSLRIYAGLWATETQIGSGLQPGCGDP